MSLTVPTIDPATKIVVEVRPPASAFFWGWRANVVGCENQAWSPRSAHDAASKAIALALVEQPKRMRLRVRAGIGGKQYIQGSR